MPETIFMPEYYKNFQCLGNECKYTCCQSWRIEIGRSDYIKIRNTKKSKEMQDLVEAAFKRYKKDSTDKHFAYMVFNEDEKCMMLSKEGLCSLQKECGAGVLPKICKIFPRTENRLIMVERACSTGCERVIEMLMERPAGIRFCTEEEPTKYTRHPLETPEMKARPVLRKYQEIRLLCIEIMQNRDYSLDDRMIVVGLALKSLDEIDKSDRENKEEEIMPWVLKHRQLMLSPGLKESLSKLPADHRYSAFSNINNMRCLQFVMRGNRIKSIERIYENLKIVVEDGDRITYQPELLEEGKENLKRLFENPDDLFENMMVNHFFCNFIPLQKNCGSIWEQYMLFCYAYSMMKFYAAGYLTKESKIEDLVFILTDCSRNMVHAAKITKELFLAQSKENQDETLAHMAALIKG